MRNLARFTFVGALLVSGLAAQPADDKHPVVVLQTSAGNITIELDAEKAPKTTENFLKYVDKGFYNDTIFHRVIPDFMIQGGGMTADMGEKKTESPIRNESGNGLTNKRGTLAMARTSDPHSATAQFFINLKDNDFLDRGDGYAVFGKVIDGMDTVDKIAKVRTTTKRGHQDVPADAVTIKSAQRKAAKP
jgi:peptidyl-prolyl cis-trans isomerase A (cyclophilin A)